MPCLRYKKLLSAYLDDELQAFERLRVETHLRDCSRCRRYHAQIQRSTELVRRLDPMPAPRFSIQRARRGGGAADRAARWERIRGGIHRGPRPALRPIAFAAMALVVLLAALQGLNRAPETTPVAPPEGGTPPPRPAPPEAGAEDRPEWLKREIAHRVLEAQAETGAGTEATPGAGAPAAAARQERGTDALAREPVIVSPPRDGAPTGEGRETVPAGDPDRSVEDARMARAAAAPAEAAPGPEEPSDPAARERSAPEPATRVVLLPGTPAADPGTDRPASEPGARTAGRRTPSPATGAEGEPPPLEIGEPLMAVAVLAEAAPESLAFVDPNRLAASRASGEPLRLESGGEGRGGTEGVETEAAPPPPDPETGIVPPQIRERPRLDLGPRAGELAAWSELAPLGLEVTVDAEGRTLEARPLTRSGLEWLDTAVAEAILDWTFRPAEEYGEPRAATVEIVVEFDLD